MRTLVFFLEEPSARAMLEQLLRRLLPDTVSVRYVTFEGKSDLHEQLEKRIRGWRTPDTSFVVLRDQDSADCYVTKNQLKEICSRAGRADTLVRIACHELESWYLGDLRAVEKGLGLRGLAGKQEIAKYRQPDLLNNAADELKKLTGGNYSKVGGSRAIGSCLSYDGSNRSRSFNVFVAGVLSLV